MKYDDAVQLWAEAGVRGVLWGGAGAALGALALGIFVHHARSGIAGKLAAMITGRPLTIVSAPDVVEKVQRLNRLETVVYSLDTVVESSESNAILPDALAGDRLLMIVHGQTIAGIDMSKLQPESVEITEGSGGRTIKLTLPPSQIFVTTIDEGKSRVYTRDTGLFVKADPNLETVTRQKAQSELQNGSTERRHSGCGDEEWPGYRDGDARGTGLRACRNQVRRSRV